MGKIYHRTFFVALTFILHATMDYKGQRNAEWLYQIIITLFGLFGFVWGYQEADFSVTFRCWVVGVALASLTCIPDWGIWNRNTPKWLEAVPIEWRTRTCYDTDEEEEEGGGEGKESKESKGKKGKKGKKRDKGTSKRSAAKAKDKGN